MGLYRFEVGGGAFVFVVVEDVEFAGIAAGDIDLATVFAEGEAVEGFWQRQELGDATCGGIDQGEAGIVESAADGQETFAVGRQDHAHRHVTGDGDGLTRGCDAPAVGEQSFTRSEVLGLSDFGGIDGVGCGTGRSGVGSVSRRANEAGQEN